MHAFFDLNLEANFLFQGRGLITERPFSNETNSYQPLYASAQEAVL